jgi:adenine/guanine phosphoribosyltransferase-like PRPP-binding protein
MPPEFKPILPRQGDDPWKLSIDASAYYERPLVDGKRKGPLVPYSGKDAKNRNYVGHVYYNFARIEEHPALVYYFAFLLAEKIPHGTMNTATTVVGIPDGGRSFGQALAQVLQKRFVYPAKVPRQISEGAMKDEYDLVFKRMDLGPSDLVLVTDDVWNNFQQTDNCLDSIAKTGAQVVALCAAFNRSPKYDKLYVPTKGLTAGMPYPLFSTMRKPCDEFEVDHPEVAEDFVKGNIVLKVKENWPVLSAAMAEG